MSMGRVASKINDTDGMRFLIGRASSTSGSGSIGFAAKAPDALICRQGQGGGRPSPSRHPDVQRAIEQNLKEGTWCTAGQARKWLETELDISRSVSCIKYWLGKLSGALKKPRPVHIKKNPAEAEDFKEHSDETLCELNLPSGRPVRIWGAEGSPLRASQFREM
jgi:transposase